MKIKSSLHITITTIPDSKKNNEAAEKNGLLTKETQLIKQLTAEMYCQINRHNFHSDCTRSFEKVVHLEFIGIKV